VAAMKPAGPHILTINGGSSSIKFAPYRVEEPLKRRQLGVNGAGAREDIHHANDPE